MILFCVFSLIVGCTKESNQFENQQTSQSKDNQYQYNQESYGSNSENNTKETNTGNRIDPHIKEVINLTDGNEKNQLLSILESKGIDTKNSTSNEITKMTYTNTYVVSYFITTNNNNELFVYKLENSYFVGKATINNGSFELKTIDNSLISSFNFKEVDKGNDYELTNFVINNNDELNNFSNEIAILHKDYTDPEVTEAYEVSCCRKRSGAWACYKCSLASAGATVITTLFGRRALIALYISCLGAGPDAWC